MQKLHFSMTIFYIFTKVKSNCIDLTEIFQNLVKSSERKILKLSHCDEVKKYTKFSWKQQEDYCFKEKSEKSTFFPSNQPFNQRSIVSKELISRKFFVYIIAFYSTFPNIFSSNQFRVKLFKEKLLSRNFCEKIVAVKFCWLKVTAKPAEAS